MRLELRRLTLLAGASFALAALAFSARSRAGYKVVDSDYHVKIVTASNLAIGSLPAARSSSDVNEFIGCTLDGSAASGNSVMCEARTSANVTKTCFSNAPWAVAVVQGLKSDSVLQFTWDGSGSCSTIEVRVGSAYPVK